MDGEMVWSWGQVPQRSARLPPHVLLVRDAARSTGGSFRYPPSPDVTYLEQATGLLMDTLPVNLPRPEIEQFCRQNRIRKLSLFGSVLTPRFRSDSDIDVLVEFEPGNKVTLFDIAGMELELSEKLGRKVDLRTPGDLSRYFRRDVVAAAAVQYERP